MRSTAPSRWASFVVVVGSLVGSLVPTVDAQSPDTPAAPPFETFSVADGLPHSVVFGVEEDRTGFVWAATREGLGRFDGRRFTTFRHDPLDPTSLATDNVSSVLVDRQGTLWVATWGGGLDRFDIETERFIHHGVEGDFRLSDLRVQTVHEDRQGRLWLGCFSGGLTRFDRRLDRVVALPWSSEPATGAGRVWAIADDLEGRVWVATDAGVGVLEPGAEAVDPPPTEAGHPLALPARALLATPDGKLFIGTESGLFLRQPSGDLRRIDLGGDRRHQALVNTIVLDWRDRLWVGTGAGLVRLAAPYDAPERFRHDADNPQSIGGDDVRRLVVGRGGTVWIALRGGGLSRVSLDDPTFHTVEARPSVPGAFGTGRVTAFAELPGGEQWVTTSHGAYRLRGGRWTLFRNDPDDPRSLPSESVSSVVVDRDGRSWFGVWRGGLCRFDPADEGFTCFQPTAGDPESIGSDRIWRLHLDARGDMWISHRDGLDRADLSGAVPRFEAIEPFRGLVARAFCETPEGELWIGSDQHGLARYSIADGAIEAFRRGDRGGLSSDRIMAIHRDPAGRLWVGTDRGLDRQRPGGGFEPFPRSDQLPGRSVVSMVGDPAGHLWAGTDGGLARIDPATDEIRIYTDHDGLPASGFGIGAAARDHRGWLYFGGLDRYVVFDPRQIGELQRTPRLVLTRFQVLGQRPAVAPHRLERAELAPGDDAFTFEYAALDDGRGGELVFRHRLIGVDSEWIDASDARADYARVDPGRYVFRVQVAGRDRVWTEQGLAIDVVLPPPFWATLWFRLGAFMTLAGMLTLAYRYRVGQLQSREQELQERVEAALAELRANEERVRRAQKLESLGVLAGGVAHDFNNLLTGVLGQLDLVRLDLPSSERAFHVALDRATEAAERAAHLSTQMLAYSGQGAFEVEGIDLSAVVEREVEAMRDELEEGPSAVRIELHLAPDLAPARADANQITQLLEALISNALEASSRRIEISTAEWTLDIDALDRLLFRDWARPGDFVELTVSDDGDGLDPTIRERLFDPFFSTRGAGRGLGLAVVLGIVRGHGGALDLASAGTGGTVVRVLLPVDSAQR